MLSGCSFTYGTGVEPHESWPKLLGINNFGLPGSSNDKICRLAIEYIRIAKPDAIFQCGHFGTDVNG